MSPTITRRTALSVRLQRGQRQVTADGGPYAYFPALTRIGAGNETGEAILPPGTFYRSCFGREWQNEHDYFIIHIEAF